MNTEGKRSRGRPKKRTDDEKKEQIKKAKANYYMKNKERIIEESKKYFDEHKNDVCLKQRIRYYMHKLPNTLRTEEEAISYIRRLDDQTRKCLIFCTVCNCYFLKNEKNKHAH